MTPKALIDAFFNTGQILADLIQPYALHLLYLLIFIEVCTIGITWMMGSDDVAEAPWRILRLVFSGMFAWWWIQNAWPLGMDLIGSFDQIGRNISNTPDGLSPAQFFDVGLRIAKLLWNSPSAGGFTHIGLEIVEAIVIVAIVFFLGILAAVAAFTLVSMMLIVGPGSIFLSFMPCRFTATLSENYFIWLVRTGALLLGFYVVLATAQHFAALWNSTLATTCGLAPSTLPVPFLGGPPTAMAAVTCRTPIPLDTLWTLFADVILLVIVGLGVPFMIASLAGHGVHLALENLASARYLAGGVARPVSKAVAGIDSPSPAYEPKQSAPQHLASAHRSRSCRKRPPESSTTTARKRLRSPTDTDAQRRRQADHKDLNHINIVAVLVLIAILIPGWGVVPVVLGFAFLEMADIVIANARRAQSSKC